MTPANRQLMRDFNAQPTFTKVFAALISPALLGALAGWLLGLSAIGYIAVQVIATIGGFLAGMEHPDARSGAIRGVVGGIIFGSSILLIRAVSDRADEVPMGSVPSLLVVITAVVGTILGALGGRRSRVG